MIFFLVFGIAMLVSGGFFAALAIQSKNPINLISTTGELTRQKGYKNYRLKNGTVPNATEYTYTYTDNGKPYSLRGVQHTHPRNLPKRVVIVYLRGFPRCAYEGHFSGIAERLLAISLLAMGLFCLRKPRQKFWRGFIRFRSDFQSHSRCRRAAYQNNFVRQGLGWEPQQAENHQLSMREN